MSDAERALPEGEAGESASPFDCDACLDPAEAFSVVAPFAALALLAARLG